jgi:transcriptional regulator with XRE-family HTH domain
MNEVSLVFARNLRVLAQTEQSVTKLCQAIEINRQQFNKYLRGEHLPSRRNRARIASYFKIAEKDLFLDSDTFEAAYGRRQSPLLSFLVSARELNELMPSVEAGAKSMRDMLGIYLRYQCSSIYEKRVLRSILRIEEIDGFIQYQYLEHFQDLDLPLKTAYRFRYQGVCLFVEERLFLIDAEVVQRNEMTFGVFIPIVRKPQRFLFGLTMGVAATAFREPYATRVALEFLDQGAIKPSHLRLARALAPEDPAIPFEIKAYLGIGNSRFGEIIRGR